MWILYNNDTIVDSSILFPVFSSCCCVQGRQMYSLHWRGRLAQDVSTQMIGSQDAFEVSTDTCHLDGWDRMVLPRQLPQGFMPVARNSTTCATWSPWFLFFLNFRCRPKTTFSQPFSDKLCTAVAENSKVWKILRHQRDWVQQETFQPDLHQGDIL